MTRRANKHSIFSQNLDRAVFVAYFLGAVVPLVALGAIFARPAIEHAAAQGGYLSQAGALAQMGVLASAAALCLGSFLVLRRFAVMTLMRLRADQARLARLVDVSQSLSEAQHAGEVARSVASSWRARRRLRQTRSLKRRPSSASARNAPPLWAPSPDRGEIRTSGATAAKGRLRRSAWGSGMARSLPPVPCSGTLRGVVF